MWLIGVLTRIAQSWDPVDDILDYILNVSPARPDDFQCAMLIAGILTDDRRGNSDCEQLSARHTLLGPSYSSILES